VLQLLSLPKLFVIQIPIIQKVIIAKHVSPMNPTPPNFLYIWAGFSLFTPGGQAIYMETHPRSLSASRTQKIISFHPIPFHLIWMISLAQVSFISPNLVCWEFQCHSLKPCEWELLSCFRHREEHSSDEFAGNDGGGDGRNQIRLGLGARNSNL
jgi:hypothetical protein